MTRTHACLMFLLASPACLGDPVSGGATLSGGTGGGSGDDPTSAEGGSGAVDDGSTTEGPCLEGLPAFEAAWQSAIDDATVAAAALEQRTAAAIAQLDMVYGLGSDDPIVFAAHIAAEVNGVAAGAVTTDVAPRRCTDIQPSAQAFASICDPGVAHTFSCLGGAQCSGDCLGSMVGDIMETCSGECWGDCDLTVGGSCEGVCVGGCAGFCDCLLGDGSCFGQCDGMCEGGNCWGAASCEGLCLGVCRSADLPPSDTTWCVAQADATACAGSVLACEGEMLVESLPSPCIGAVGLGTTAANICAPRPASITFERDPGVDERMASFVKTRLYDSRDALAELMGVVSHLDLLLGHPGPNLCDGTPGTALGDAHQALQQALQQQRDALDGFATLLVE